MKVFSKYKSTLVNPEIGPSFCVAVYNLSERVVLGTIQMHNSPVRWGQNKMFCALRMPQRSLHVKYNVQQFHVTNRLLRMVVGGLFFCQGKYSDRVDYLSFYLMVTKKTSP